MIYSQPVKIYADASDDTNFVSFQQQLKIRPLMTFFIITADPEQNQLVINPGQTDERRYSWSMISGVLQNYIIRKSNKQNK